MMEDRIVKFLISPMAPIDEPSITNNISIAVLKSNNRVNIIEYLGISGNHFENKKGNSKKNGITTITNDKYDILELKMEISCSVLFLVAPAVLSINGLIDLIITLENTANWPQICSAIT